MVKDTGIRVGRELEREFPGADHRATGAIINLARTESLIVGRLSEHLRAYDLTVGTFNVLMILRGAEGPLCPWEISERRLVARGTVTGLLDSLEKRGLIRRDPHPEDRRMINVELTIKARELLDRLLPGFHAYEAALLRGLSQREKDTLIDLLGKLQAGLPSEG
ncbi:MAG TPA: MarR family transcriptional regulator [Actinomycetota bacterium]